LLDQRLHTRSGISERKKSNQIYEPSTPLFSIVSSYHQPSAKGTNVMKYDKAKLLALVEQMRARKAAEEAEVATISGEANDSEQSSSEENNSEPEANSGETNSDSSPTQNNSSQILDKYGNLITLNDKQLEFVTLAGSGKSCVLIGAAGTGKTTCQKAVVENLIQTGQVGILQSDGHKHLESGTPGIVICAYTRRAVANIRRNMPADLQRNCITIHKLLEYQPVYYEVPDKETGGYKTIMKFEATRNGMRPLPSSIKKIVFEESSMLGTELHQEVIDACPHRPQIIYLGDIQQLPPVFGPAILGFKLLELPVVELTEVYRQALESPIIALAHRILSGSALEAKAFGEWDFPGKLKIRPWKKKIDSLNAVLTLGGVFKAFESEGLYDPEEDIILLPFNKACGTIELNKIIANHLARKRGAVTSEIVAGFNKVYLSPGDRVLYDKEDATVISVEKNPAYTGTMPVPASSTLDYWGHDPNIHTPDVLDDDGLDFVLSQTAMAADSEDRVKKCSHKIKLLMADSEQEITLDSAGDVNALLLGYCLTVHKSQGSEWRKVFLCLHQSHATMIQRELLYTAVTRAREELYVICEAETFVKGIESQRVLGNTLAEKAEFFKGKKKRMEEEELS
jgi:exodeoxyribonuclease V alpha subunit